ncbi:hypothetical protein [Terrimonas pollutisoli]|uniref:hypothetical protein n=1 Tax=Terrimonas pollutisoli TaxID=3034147 RepID=UPI0023EB0A48|nr:hypothetical protein [Terrimonas sp. H1YJ31]
MLITMQGNWTVAVKSKSAAFPQRFIIAGAVAGNGTYNGVTATPAVSVIGDQWTIAIQNDDGSGFQLSDTRIKFPVKIGNNVSFDIESNDAGADADFNDLILTCSTVFSESDFLIYGNVTRYSGCIINPCIRRWVVVDTYKGLLEALKYPKLREVIEKLYPERVPVVPIPPDPPPYFTPLMINLQDEAQLPPKLANVFRRTDSTDTDQKTAPKKVKAETNTSRLSFSRTAVVGGAAASMANRFAYDKVALGAIKDSLKFVCTTGPAANITLNFEEYDRTAAELAGGPYTGTGNRTVLGSSITDMFGNYIFRFRQSLSELADEVTEDIASGETEAFQILPDVIVKVNQLAPFFTTLFESAPYFNIPSLKRVDLCLPDSKLPSSSICFNGNLVGSLGNVFVGGNQNTTASTLPASLDRNGYNNHLRADGKVTVHNTQALFNIDCACWGGTIDMFGCMFNILRKKSDPIIRNYTIRYRRAGTSNWEFVNQTYLHPKFSKRNLPNYNGDQVGPFLTPLHINGNGNPKVTVPAYINIQAEVNVDGVDWEASHLDRYMQLNTNIYDWDNASNSHLPGKIYFRVDGWDSNGKLVPGATDLIALFISNKTLDFGLGAVDFVSPIEKIPCGLYKMAASELNTALRILFKANDPYGFVNHYKLTFSKCPSAIKLDILSPALPENPNISGILVNGVNANNTDGNDCPGNTGTIADFATTGFVNVELQPDSTEGGWLKSTEEFGVFSVHLEASRRSTNGYNSGIEGLYLASAAFYIIKK